MQISSFLMQNPPFLKQNSSFLIKSRTDKCKTGVVRALAGGITELADLSGIPHIQYEI